MKLLRSYMNESIIFMTKPHLTLLWRPDQECGFVRKLCHIRFKGELYIIESDPHGIHAEKE